MSINTLRTKDIEVNKFECWNQEIQHELLALERTFIWEIVDSSSNIKPIGCRWIYKIKFHVDGGFKARLVAKGYNQIYGLYYFDIYFFVAKMTSIKLGISLTTINR